MNQKSQSSDGGRYTSIAIQMIAIILIGVFGGHYLDKYLELKFPVFTVVLSFASVIFAIYFVVKDLIKKK
jgi:F0F1-type ATP synthase assembly protein I